MLDRHPRPRNRFAHRSAPASITGSVKTPSLTRRLSAIDWDGVRRDLVEGGVARVQNVLDPTTCATLIALFDRSSRFRKTIDMEHHGFGRGHYRYFAEPLPRVVGTLRRRLYAELAPAANVTWERLGRAPRFPDRFEEYRAWCHAQGQTRPTPLLLRYEATGYNCLHRDLYGPATFPIQAAFGLSEPGTDYDGGEFLLVENRPRQQARGYAARLERGEMILFFVSDRPVPGKRGWLRAQVRHGVSPLSRGRRYVLGVIFHDAE